MDMHRHQQGHIGVRHLVLVLLFVSTVAGAAFTSDALAVGKADGREVSEKDDIPKSPKEVSPSTPISKEYDTYSLFLIPESWNSTKPSELRALRQGFQQFGVAIGHDHLAVWFVKTPTDERLDFERMKRYGRLCLYPPSRYPFEQGPYVVLLRQHPDRMKEGDPALVLQLKRVSAERAKFILSTLERDLKAYDASHPDFSEQALELERVQQIIMTSMEEHVTELSDLFVTLLSWK